MSLNLPCPGCGSELAPKNPGVVQVVCEHCGNAVWWDGQAIRNLGRQSILPEGFSRLYRGATGRLAQSRFRVAGRIRYAFPSGFWDEWYLAMEDGTWAWLTEDDHELAIERAWPEAKVTAPFISFAPGQRFSLGGVEWHVEELGTARCLGMEGELPEHADTGDSYPYIDASSLDGRYSLGIEYDQNPPTAFKGHWLRWSALKLDDEGDDW